MKKERNKRDAFMAGPASTLRLLRQIPPPSHSPSRGPRPVLMYPTLVSLKNAKIASVVFSFHSHQTEGALGCFHPHAFPISLHNLVIWGRRALHPVNKRWRVYFLPPPYHQYLSSSGTSRATGVTPPRGRQGPAERMEGSCESISPTPSRTRLNRSLSDRKNQRDPVERAPLRDEGEAEDEGEEAGPGPP